MKLMLMFSILFIVSPAQAQTPEFKDVPVPLEDLYVCMENPEPESGACADFDQIKSDVYWAYLAGRPVVYGQYDPFIQTWQLLRCFDNEDYTPPEYDAPCMYDGLGYIWDYINAGYRNGG